MLLELASLAKPLPEAPPLLPARAHMLFRGLLCLWACVNPQCSKIAEEERGGSTGALNAGARQSCDVTAERKSMNCRVAAAVDFRWPGPMLVRQLA